LIFNTIQLKQLFFFIYIWWMFCKDTTQIYVFNTRITADAIIILVKKYSIPLIFVNWRIINT
jgi:hypothetical protein